MCYTTLRFSNGLRFMVLIGILMVKVQASGKFTILLVNFKNPKHRLFNGGCCDNLNWCYDNCDNYFRFCASTLGSVDQCSISLLQTKVLGDDSFTFDTDLGGGLKNPITYSFDKWKGVSVSIDVWDNDGGQLIGKLDDFVDKYNLVVTQTPSKNKKSSSPKAKKLCGKASCTNIKTEVYCDDKYLIPQCSEYCEPRDNEVHGHYNCDYDRGLKICLDGWYDALTNCTKKKKECAPRNDTAGHYDCDPVSGEKICLIGWMGANCTQVYIPPSLRPSSTKAYTQTNHGTTSTKTTTASLTTTAGNENIKTTELSTSKTLNTATIQPTSTIRLTRTHGLFIKSSSRVVRSSRAKLYSTTVHSKQKTSSLPSSASLLMVSMSSGKPTLTPIVIPTSIVMSSLSQGLTTIRPTAGLDHTVIVKVSPRTKWTNKNEEKLKNIITDHLNAICTKKPSSCNISLNTTSNRTMPFNTSNIIITVKNTSTDGDLSVAVKVKVPVTIPGLTGGILVPSVIIKDIIKRTKTKIESQTGLKVSIDTSIPVSMTTTTEKPRTTFPRVEKKGTPDGNIIPGLDDYWAVIVCALAATLLLLAITLCFSFHANRPNKVHPIKELPRTKVMEFTASEDTEIITLTTLDHVTNKTMDKFKAKDKVLRSRSQSGSTEKQFPASPFTPDYLDF